MWRASVLTLFPDMFPGPLAHSLAGRALREGVWSLDALDIRGFATDRHRSVDDTPFGGGAGMVMRPDVLDAEPEGPRQHIRDRPLLRAHRVVVAAKHETGAGAGQNEQERCGRPDASGDREPRRLPATRCP